MEKAYERRRKEERKPETNDRADELVLDLDSYMTLDVCGMCDGNQFFKFLTCWSFLDLHFISIVKGDGENGPTLKENLVGEEYVKKVEVYFCEICQRYLGRLDNLDRVLELHCRSPAHHRAFLSQERQNNCKSNDGSEIVRSLNFCI